MTINSSQKSDELEITWAQTARGLESGAWVSLIFVPISFTLNGPSVSTDQASVRWLLVGATIVGVLVSLGVRASRVVRKRMSR